MRQIEFIVVNFNNSAYTQRLLASLSRQQSPGYSIRCNVVDNSTSTKEASDCEKIAGQYRWATYLRPSKNLGYFGGLNYGLGRTDRAATSFLVICNNDLEFDEQFCANLAEAEYDQSVFAVCPDVVTAEGFHQNPHIRTRISRFRRLQFDVYFAHYYMSLLLSWVLRIVRPVKASPVPPPEGCELHMGVGACYVLTREFLNRFRTLNYPFFLYGEEAYFSDQIHSAGGILWFDPSLRVHHAESAALSKVPSRTAYEYARDGYSDYRRLM
jgi:GT2 family glycosyltransferase